TNGKDFIKVWLRGSLPNIDQIEDVKIIKGRFINDSDLKYCRKSIVIDEIMQTILFKEADPLGEKIKVGSSMFTVVGVYKGDATRSTSASFIPLTTGQLIYKANDQHVSQAILTVKNIDSDEKMKAFEQRVVRRLSIEHHFDPTDMSAIWLYNRMEDYKDAMMVFIGINIFVWIIGLGTLLSGVVGVSNIMLVTVTERTAEFGIRKSLGAKPSSIVRLILTESVLVTSIFGYVGMVLGVAVMEVVNYYIVNAPLQESEGFNETIFIDPTLDISVAVSATLVLVLAGLIAGYIPANRAAKLKTIDALRYNK
ncbi:MAG: FtsX-like permease family protein, partial [Rikenellaceae bacterium]